MKSNITKLYEAFGMEKIFGRSDVIEEAIHQKDENP